jgi:hypothetical protein
MRVGRQTAIDELDAPAIEEFTSGRESDEHSRATVLGDADTRASLRSSSRHVFLLPERDLQLRWAQPVHDPMRPRDDLANVLIIPVRPYTPRLRKRLQSLYCRNEPVHHRRKSCAM